MATPTPAPASGREGKRLLYGGVAAFLVTCVILFFLGNRIFPASTTEPGFAVDETARPSADGTFQVTLDTADRTHWVAFDLAAGAVVSPAHADSADLVIRRYTLRAPHGALALGDVPLAAAHLPESPTWIGDQQISGEPQNPALKGWYRYSYWTHLLRSRGATYAVKLAGRGIAYLHIKSYYCKPEGSGCLTLQYRLDLESAGGR